MGNELPAVVSAAAFVALVLAASGCGPPSTALASPVNLTDVYHRHVVTGRGDGAAAAAAASAADDDDDAAAGLFDFAADDLDGDDSPDADSDEDPTDDLADDSGRQQPPQPADFPADFREVDLTEYETEDGEGGAAAADGVGDVDPDAAADPVEPEADESGGPAIAAVAGPKVTRKGKTYSWRYSNLQPKSLKPFGLVRDVWGGAKPNANRAWVHDPKDPRKVVLQVAYPKGTSTPTSKWSPKGKKGGTGFFAAPISPETLAKARYVTFQFEVFFPANFNFVKGGKLPGLWGGAGNRLGCSGGSSAGDCFSLRFMFRGGGAGEEYIYVPKSVKQRADFCKIPPFTHCDPVYGSSVGRGSFGFKRGGWTKVKQLVALNEPGKQNGVLKVWANDKLVISYGKVVWRTSGKVTVRGIAFETFFGGSTKQHVSQKNERAFFRNFQMDAAL